MVKFLPHQPVDQVAHWRHQQQRQQRETCEGYKPQGKWQQAEQQMMQLQQGAQAAKVLSEADTQNPNALTALLQGGGTTV